MSRPPVPAPFAVFLLALAAVLPAPRAGGPSSRSVPMTAWPRRNLLADESSPYLLQHADNPVWWRPWSDDAFREARERDVPVFLSIGYSTCHWCHVMERESFEDPEVARFLNRHFVSIKVDREERPDVDALYMDAVHALGRRGGWPLSAWLLPDGRPFLAGSYFPRDRFLAILRQVHRLWTEERDHLDELAGRLAAALAAAAEPPPAIGSLDVSLLERHRAAFARRFDPVHGGFRGAPKFPPALDVRLLLRTRARFGDESARAMAVATLAGMARGGICDHVEGGFHRYSTDEAWAVPHFEKMLYDQAMLIEAFLDGWLATGNPEDREVVEEIAGYVLDRLEDPEGGFWSAEDADAGGEEGRFHTWTEEELAAALSPPERAIADRWFGTGGRPLLAGRRHVLRLPADGSGDRVRRPPEVRAVLAKLAEVREQRPRPARDEKILVDWNGLAIAALARAGAVLGKPRWVNAAARAARRLVTACRDARGNLLHRLVRGRAGIPGFLDDHAFLVRGLLALYEATGDPSWFGAALDLQEREETLFLDPRTGDWFTTGPGHDPRLAARRRDPHDGVVPAGRAVTAENLLRLATLARDDRLRALARRTLAATPRHLRENPLAFPATLAAVDLAAEGPGTIVVVGAPEAREPLLAEVRRRFLPGFVVAPGNPGATVPPLLAGHRLPAGAAAACWVCRRGGCLPPATDPGTLGSILDGLGKPAGAGR